MLFSNLSIKMVFKGKKDTHLNSTTEDTLKLVDGPGWWKEELKQNKNMSNFSNCQLI